MTCHLRAVHGTNSVASLCRCSGKIAKSPLCLPIDGLGVASPDDVGVPLPEVKQTCDAGL
jgi:hypothetical protein